jgi:hypothetical protein
VKVRLAIISPQLLAEVRREVEMLRAAVNAGDMDGVDAVTAKLLTMTARCPSVDLPEKKWREFLGGIRTNDPSFESTYLLPGELCTSVLPTASADDFTLELPIDD